MTETGRRRRKRRRIPCWKRDSKQTRRFLSQPARQPQAKNLLNSELNLVPSAAKLMEREKCGEGEARREA